MMNKWMSMVAVLMLALVLAACGGGAATGTTTGDTPESVAKSFLEASLAIDFEKAKTMVCAAQAEAMSGTDTTAAAAAAAAAQFDFSGLTFTASDVTDATATVTVGGILKVTSAGQTQEMDVATMGMTSLPMVKESGAWKACPAGM